MTKYALIDENGVILSYSDFPIVDYPCHTCNDQGEQCTKHITCVPNVVYSPDYIGKTYNINIKEVII
jgi:hypothetical protein